jgi:hypothetical protein
VNTLLVAAFLEVLKDHCVHALSGVLVGDFRRSPESPPAELALAVTLGDELAISSSQTGRMLMSSRYPVFCTTMNPQGAPSDSSHRKSLVPRRGSREEEQKN